MPRTINADGRTITVPDDATPEEINEIVGPPRSAAPPAPPAKSFWDRVEEVRPVGMEPGHGAVASFLDTTFGNIGGSIIGAVHHPIRTVRGGLETVGALAEPITPGVAPEMRAKAKEIRGQFLKQSGESWGDYAGRMEGQFYAMLPFVASDIAGGKGPAPIEDTKIAGVKIPETVGQKYGRSGGFTRTVEHYAAGTYLGGPLRSVEKAQMTAMGNAVSKLSRIDPTKLDPGEVAKNWEMATQETRIAADPLYDSIREVQVPKTVTVAQSILLDDNAVLSPASRKALGNLSGEGPESVHAKNLGYKSKAEAISKIGQRTWDQTLAAEQGESKAAPTVGNAIKARHALDNQIKATTDRGQRFALQQARDTLNKSIDDSLDGDAKVTKQQADLLYRRSYIQDKIAAVLRKGERSQSPAATPMVRPNAFVSMVNDLARRKLTHTEGTVRELPSDLDVLYDNPADRKAMLDLSVFLKEKHSNFAGAAGLSESIARIGVALETTSLPLQALIHPQAAAIQAAGLLGTYALSEILAHPGGPEMILKYLRSTPASQAVQATRLAAMLKHPATEQNADHTSLPAPRQNATDEWSGPQPQQ